MSQQMQFWTRSLFLQIIANILQPSSSHFISDTTNNERQVWGGGGLPHSDAKDFLIIKANLGSDTVIYN